MESLSLKLENQFLLNIEKAMKKHNYSTKTEFIREAIRDKIKDLEKEEALLRLKNMYGASKRKTSKKDLELAGEKAFEEIKKRFK